MDVKKTFDLAKLYYRDALNHIKDAGILVGMLRKEKNLPHLMSNLFDQTLQYILLSQAMEDSDLCLYECEFIDRIAESGDILDTFSKRTNTDLSWSKLQSMPNFYIMQLIVMLGEDYFPAMNEFVKYFVEADIKTSNNFFQLIEKDILKILICLARIDGKEHAGEIERGEENFNNLFKERYLEVKDRYIKFHSYYEHN